MPDAIDDARQVLESRLAEIEAEAAKIRAALQGLGFSAPGLAPVPTKPGPRPKDEAANVPPAASAARNSSPL